VRDGTLPHDAATGFGVEHSFTGRRWLAPALDSAQIDALALASGLPEVVCRLLAARGVCSTTAADFLNPTLRRFLPDPSLLADMDRAADRLAAAVMEGETVGVFGDYDVDGATSAALVRRFLAAIGLNCRLYVPDRLTEGYGPNAPALLRLHAEGVSLLITVDCGTSAHAPLAAAAAAGLDVIVVDHHQCTALPPAFAVVNPSRPDDASGLTHLAAVGVAFLLVVATNRALRRAGWYRERAEPDLRRWLDLVALGTLCDMVPLAGVNRAFVLQGLKVMSARTNPGLSAITVLAGLTPHLLPRDLGFAIGPRINAGGRVGAADLGARLLSTDDAEEARSVALRLEGFNRERQQIEKGVLERALAQVGSAPDPLVWAIGEGWHPGVIGIVASRLVDRFHKPAIVATVTGDQVLGSGRSIPGIDLGSAINAALTAGLLTKGGGHAMAGGFSVLAERVAEFRDFLVGAVSGADPAVLLPTLQLEARLTLSAINGGLLRSVGGLMPYGAGNPEPVFAVCDVLLDLVQPVQAHLRCRLRDAGGRTLTAMAFRAAGSPLGAALVHARQQEAMIHVAGRVRAGRHENGDAAFLALDDAAFPR
jgi:single-stranded-DNA-specific exonuclease